MTMFLFVCASMLVNEFEPGKPEGKLQGATAIELPAAEIALCFCQPDLPYVHGGEHYLPDMGAYTVVYGASAYRRGGRRHQGQTQGHSGGPRHPARCRHRLGPSSSQWDTQAHGGVVALGVSEPEEFALPS
jgi:hypothetical protein